MAIDSIRDACLGLRTVIHKITDVTDKTTTYLDGIEMIDIHDQR